MAVWDCAKQLLRFWVARKDGGTSWGWEVITPLPLPKFSLLWAKIQRLRPKRGLSYYRLRRKLGFSSEPEDLNPARSCFKERWNHR